VIASSRAVSAFSYLRTKSFNGSSVEGINARSAEPWIGKHNSMPSMNPSRLTKPICKAVSSKSQGRGESASATAPQSFRGDGLSSPNRPRRDQPRQPNWQRRVKSALPLPVLGMGVSSLMNDIELACLLLPRGKG
jgi:hypothetical protein